MPFKCDLNAAVSIITVWKVGCGHEYPLVGMEEWL